jgi:ABC-type transport system substrate-binding protein
VTMYSLGSAAFGDLSRLLSNLYIPSARNKDRYSNPDVNKLYADYVASSDAKTHQDQLKTIQELIGQDVPIVHLANPYQIVAASAKVSSFKPHPLDSYKYNADIRIA